MWFAVDGLWAYGWWWLGMMIICALVMRGMGHRMMGSHRPGRDLYSLETPEVTLASRLAHGEIDIDEYTRLLEALLRPAGSTEVRRY